MNKLAIIAGNAGSDICENLKKDGFNIIKTMECKKVYDSIRYHPDIVMTKIDENTIITAPSMYDYFSESLKGYDINIIKGESLLSDSYPKDISYNLAVVGKYAFHNLKYTDRVLLEELAKRNITMVDITQGYSKCSIAVVDDENIITSDRIIYEAAKKIGINVLFIHHGNIFLENQNYGFIGGSTGKYNNKFYISGKLSNHPDEERIIDFVKKTGKQLIYLSDKDIVDIGTIFTFRV